MDTIKGQWLINHFLFVIILSIRHNYNSKCLVNILMLTVLLKYIQNGDHSISPIFFSDMQFNYN